MVARASVGLGFLAAHGAVDGLTPGAPPRPLVQGLVAWDGAFYRDIATVGYSALPEEALRFFPLFPVLGRLVGAVVPGGATTGLVLVANLAALATGYMLHRLVVLEGASVERAATATWVVALLPASSVLVLAYTEGLFLALSIGAFLAMRTRRWWLVAGLGVLTGLCRPSGVVLALPVAIEAARGLRATPSRDRVSRAAAVVGAPLGTALYLAWAGDRFGDPLLPLRVHSSGELRGTWVDPLTRVVTAVLDAPAGGFVGEALHLPWIALFVALAVVAGRRLPAPYTAYTAVVLLLALSAESLGSFERYSLPAFPLAMVAASLLGHGTRRLVALATSAAALSAFTSLVLLGVFVP